MHMSFVHVLDYNWWTSSVFYSLGALYLKRMTETATGIISLLPCIILYIYVYVTALFDSVSMWVLGNKYMRVYLIGVCVTHICRCIYVYVFLGSSCDMRCRLCVLACVFPSEIECVLFYRRKIAYQDYVSCCILYQILNLMKLILS